MLLQFLNNVCNFHVSCLIMEINVFEEIITKWTTPVIFIKNRIQSHLHGFTSIWWMWILCSSTACLDRMSLEYLGTLNVKSLTEMALAHCDKLFGRCWMDGHSVVEVSLGGTHLDSHCKSLQHFVTAQTNHVNSNNLQLFSTSSCHD